MAMDIWTRATAKWRGLLVYVLLDAAMRFTTDIIVHQAHTRGLIYFGGAAGVATSIYCLIQMWRLLMSDAPGDENWPPLWS